MTDEEQRKLVEDIRAAEAERERRSRYYDPCISGSIQSMKKGWEREDAKRPPRVEVQFIPEVELRAGESSETSRTVWTDPARPPRFAIMGVGGYVAPRHLSAIQAVGGTVVAACDPSDSVGILDRYNLDCEYFREFERFERFMETSPGIDYLVVCTPNYLHDCHVRLGLRTGCNVICEKPLTLTTKNLDALAAAERRYERRVWTILQLRLNPKLVALREKLLADPKSHDVYVDYHTPRGHWYHRSWKGDPERSGGVAMNIGVHMFDLLLWMFGGETDRAQAHRSHDGRRLDGNLWLARADVGFTMSVNKRDIPASAGDVNSYRRMEVDGEEIDLSDGFTDAHTESYRRILRGEGFGIEDARPSIELVEGLSARLD